MQVFIAILAIALMIVIHEWGHFIAGRICKIPVYEFSIGMGPLICKWKGKKETTYSLRWIPLGGFCSFDKLEDLNNSAENGITDAALDKLPIHKRIFICAMGPIMNLVFAFILILGVSVFAGETIPTTRIFQFADNSPAAQYMQVDDYIYSINDVVVYNQNTLTKTINEEMKNHDSLSVTIIRGEEYLTYDITPTYDETTKLYYLGVYQASDYASVPISEAIPRTFKTIGQYITSVYSSLGGLITGKYKVNEMSGIVGTVAFMGDYVNQSTLVPFISLCALISVNLGIMNLLPIPALDGSKILFAIIEFIRKKPMNKDFEVKLTMIGFSLLILLSIVLIVSDVFKLL